MTGSANASRPGFGRSCGTSVFAHVLAFHDGPDGFAAAAERFVRDGLDAGERVVVAAATAPLAALGCAGADLVDLERLGNPGRFLPSVLLPAAADGTPVRVLQQPLWTEGGPDRQRACAHYESAAALALADYPMLLVCMYDRNIEPEALSHPSRTHGLVLDDDRSIRRTGHDPAAVNEVRAEPLPEPAEILAELRFDERTRERTRIATRDAAAGTGLPLRRVDETELIVSELTANSVEHGGGRGVLRLWRDENALICEVSDTGHIADPLAGQLPVGLATDGGRGLFLAHALADLVTIHTRPGTTTVRARFAA